MIHALSGKEGLKTTLLQYSSGCDIFQKPDTIHFGNTNPLCHHRQKCLHRFCCIPIPCECFRDMISDFPFALSYGNQLDITDVFILIFCNHGINQRSFRRSILRNKKLNRFFCIFQGLEDFIRHKSPSFSSSGSGKDMVIGSPM